VEAAHAQPATRRQALIEQQGHGQAHPLQRHRTNAKRRVWAASLQKAGIENQAVQLSIPNRTG